MGETRGKTTDSKAMEFGDSAGPKMHLNAWGHLLQHPGKKNAFKERITGPVRIRKKNGGPFVPVLGSRSGWSCLLDTRTGDRR